MVDDLPENLEVLMRALKPHFQVRAVRSGKQALRDSEIPPVPDLILLDIMMPEMDGFEVLARLRDNPKTRGIPVIFVTARDDDKDEQHGFDLGAVDYITKPIRPAVVLARVRLHLELKQARDRLAEQNDMLEARILERTRELEHSQRQTMMSEKMAAIGLLAAGIAHEINNPTSFISTNLHMLNRYQQNLREMISIYRHTIEQILPAVQMGSNSAGGENLLSALMDQETELDIPFILEDLPNLIKDSCEGIDRITKIVQDLKFFSHPGEDSMQLVDINRNLDSTLNIVWNEIKYKATVTRNYGQLPHVNCYPQQMNQVFMNLLVNAAQAIVNRGEIQISTRENNGFIEITISDTGQGIPPDKIGKIFDPFYTTKPIGKGTGLGLNLSYSIIKKHNGTIDVQSEVEKGTIFTIRIPVHGPDIHIEPDFPDHGVCYDDSL